MRQPLRAKAPQRQRVSVFRALPPPVGGWNTQTALESMKPTEAIWLDNWYPKASYCETRGGYTTDANSATGMNGNGKTLAVYNALSGTNKMFCSTASDVYDVSSPGAVGASVASRTNGKHQWRMFGDGTNNWLIMVNGVDKPLYYDGSTWTAVDNASTPALTGLTTTEIISLFISKGRLYFIQKASLSFWYLAAGAAGGALTEFDLSGVAKKGGYLMAGETWTIDAGDGPDDRVVFVTSEGECIIYAGTNPGSANTWALVGVYDIGKPIGRRCLTRAGGDLIVITQNGTFPMSAALQSAAIDYKLALSFKIESAFTDSARTYGSNFGWEATIFPAQSAMLVNIPLAEDGTHYQYVMNTQTKSWCRFKGWDAEAFAVFNGELYFTSGNKVRRAWTGTADGGTDIYIYGKQAFSYFGEMGLLKQFKLFQPVLAVNGPIEFLTDIDIDFKDTELAGVASYSVVAGALWDASDWDEGYWASNMEIVRDWTSPAEWEGYCVSGKIKFATNSLIVQWMASNHIYEKGGLFS